MTVSEGIEYLKTEKLLAENDLKVYPGNKHLINLVEAVDVVTTFVLRLGGEHEREKVDK